MEKKMINEEYILRIYFTKILREVDWTHLYSLSHSNHAYIVIFCVLHAFLVKEMIIKLKSFLNPWMSKGLQRSPKVIKKETKAV